MELTLFHRSETGNKFQAFLDQQEIVHASGLALTLFVTADSLADPRSIPIIRRYRDGDGDELGLSLHSLPGFPTDFIWLLSPEEKRRAIRTLIDSFREQFGTEPKTVAAYHMDATTMAILAEEAPSTVAVVAGCFEEGVRVFHGCNHSWYLFNEGMPWWPWYPARNHALCPTPNAENRLPFLAVPHLVRDMVLSYEGRNDYFASHPANVIRGMGHGDKTSPYDLNLIDQYRMQEAWNEGYSFYTVFVGAQWMIPNPNIEIPVDDVKQRYIDQLAYLAELRSRGELRDHHLSGFAEWYKSREKTQRCDRFWAKEILIGSGKHLYWHKSDDYRLTVDAHQGGSIGDLRPYVAQFHGTTGPDSNLLSMGSYPYLIQSQHRTGAQHHYEDGTRSTMLISNGSEEIDLSDYPTRIEEVSNEEGTTRVRFAPIPIVFKLGAHITVTTTYVLEEGPMIGIEREYTTSDSKDTPITVTEYFKGTYGWTEYPEDLRTTTVELVTADRVETIPFRYDGERTKSPDVREAAAVIPEISCRIALAPADGQQWLGTVGVGTLFSPYYTLSISRSIHDNTNRSFIWLNMTRL